MDTYILANIMSYCNHDTKLIMRRTNKLHYVPIDKLKLRCRKKMTDVEIIVRRKKREILRSACISNSKRLLNTIPFWWWNIMSLNHKLDYALLYACHVQCEDMITLFIENGAKISNEILLFLVRMDIVMLFDFLLSVAHYLI